VVDLDVEGRRVVTAGEGDPLDEEEMRELAEAVTGNEVEYELTIPGEGGETEVFFSDLSHDYVTTNAEYTT
jgi:glutamate N-acetyltransferase/amino-acid N-acetyltransferase